MCDSQVPAENEPKPVQVLITQHVESAMYVVTCPPEQHLDQNHRER